jgi:hypothetical protein
MAVGLTPEKKKVAKHVMFSNESRATSALTSRFLTAVRDHGYEASSSLLIDFRNNVDKKEYTITLIANNTY